MCLECRGAAAGCQCAADKRGYVRKSENKQSYSGVWKLKLCQSGCKKGQEGGGKLSPETQKNKKSF